MHGRRGEGKKGRFGSACGCVQVRAGARGCVRVRAGACGCVRVRAGACGCVLVLKGPMDQGAQGQLG
jgi:hypothetical protein